MRDAVHAELPSGATVVIMAAAVATSGRRLLADRKIKKEDLA